MTGRDFQKRDFMLSKLTIPPLPFGLQGPKEK
jgi:hypothetical protein